MADDFSGSIAQNNLTYSISTSVQTTPGSNYYTPMIFIGSGTNATANFVSVPTTNAVTTVNASNFSSIVKGTLLTWLRSYFAVNNGLTAVNLVVYDSVPASYAGLTTAYGLVKNLSYHKFIFEPLEIAKSRLVFSVPLTRFFLSSGQVSMMLEHWSILRLPVLVMTLLTMPLPFRPFLHTRLRAP